MRVLTTVELLKNWPGQTRVNVRMPQLPLGYPIFIPEFVDGYQTGFGNLRRCAAYSDQPEEGFPNSWNGNAYNLMRAHPLR